MKKYLYEINFGTKYERIHNQLTPLMTRVQAEKYVKQTNRELDRQFGRRCGEKAYNSKTSICIK